MMIIKRAKKVDIEKISNMKLFAAKKYIPD